MGSLKAYLEYKILKRTSKLLNNEGLLINKKAKMKVSRKRNNKQILKYLHRNSEVKPFSLKFKNVSETDLGKLREIAFKANKLTKTSDWLNVSFGQKYTNEMKEQRIAFKEESSEKILALIRDIINRIN
ncbi:hypothetical protein CDIK_1861 [Cucumispora dikerogammari]|nr:hypothetical protein CDIK_1861 [Cucumispora dikerogammari]